MKIKIVKLIRWKVKKHFYLPISKFKSTFNFLFFSSLINPLTPDLFPSRKTAGLFAFTFSCFFISIVLNYISCFVFYGFCGSTSSFSIFIPIYGNIVYKSGFLIYFKFWFDMLVFVLPYVLIVGLYSPKLILFRIKLSCYLFFGSILIGYILAILFSAINMIVFGLETNLFDYHLSSSDKMGGRLELIWSLDGLLWPQVISKNILVSIYSVSSILVPFVFFQLLGRKIFGFSLFKASIFSMFSFLYVSIVSSFLY